jgi:dTDP-3-amino-3,4,6-trideoxy-alpha-D-glucose transaminase
VAERAVVPLLDMRAAAAELDAELVTAAIRVVRSAWYVGGDEVTAFERAWASYCESAHAVGTANGMDAIALALRALGVGPGDEVVVPAFTFVATWLAVSAVGAEVVPVECAQATANIDPDRLEAAVGPRTRAIVPVHLYGQPADMDAVRAIADPLEIAVVEDAAQAHGATWRGRRVGSLGSAAAFSFYPVKNLGALGDGGAVVTADAALAARVRVLGNYGAARKYEHELRGANSRLDAIQAALLAAKLRHLDAWNARRRAVARRYLEALADLAWLELPAVSEHAEPVWHLFVVRCDDRDALRAHLADRGIQTGLHYPQAPHRSGAYAGMGLRLPGADRLAERSLSLPMGPHLSLETADRVAEAVRAHG